jgi:hypothetical protein
MSLQLSHANLRKWKQKTCVQRARLTFSRLQAVVDNDRWHSLDDLVVIDGLGSRVARAPTCPVSSARVVVAKVGPPRRRVAASLALFLGAQRRQPDELRRRNPAPLEQPHHGTTHSAAFNFTSAWTAKAERRNGIRQNDGKIKNKVHGEG